MKKATQIRVGVLAILIATFLILKEKKFQQKVYAFSLIALSVILSRGIIAEAFKFFIARQRPFSVLKIEPLLKYETYDKFMSFPSGHAAFFFALALITSGWTALFSASGLAV